MPDHNAPAPADALAALKDVNALLSSHPGFQVVPARVPSGPSRATWWLGIAIRSFRFRKFGAKFESGLTLLSFQMRWETACDLILELQWHAAPMGEGLAVFIHFVDAAGEIRFQADYPLESQAQDALGFFFSRRRVEVPRDAPRGEYRVRVGVWRPAESKHVKLSHFRGCRQEAPGWCDNAVIVDSVQIGEPYTHDPAANYGA